MSDLIDRRAAIDALEEPCKVSDTWTDEYAVGERTQWEKDVKTLNSLPSAHPTEASCWGCNCPKMERLKMQKTFSEMVHLHDAETHNKRTETHGVCLDTISRQAAIDAIYKESRLANSEVAEEYAEMYACALRELPSAQPTDADIQKMQDIEQAMLEKAYECGKQDAAQWIPCSEKLPQPNEEDADGFIKAYLVQDGRWMDVARWNGDCWIAWGYGTALTNVIAWMPLPKPYAERRTDE